MPIKKTKSGYQYGEHGKVYPTKKEAEEQMRAMYAHGYKSDEKKKRAK